MFSDLVKLLYSDDILDRHQAIIGIRKILSLNESPPISLVFDHNILPIIIEYMKQDIYPHLRLEATWCVSNIGTGSSEDVMALVENGVLPLLIQFLS
jgi:importin subunit alpha-1